MASFWLIFSALPLLLSLSVTPPPLLAAEIHLPSLGGDSSASLLSPQQELLLGEAFMRSLRKQVSILEQPVINHYIQTLGQTLVLQSETPTAPFEFFVVEDDSINAFAGPAGKIGIHSGLIMKAKSEGELAAVLAHEIAHVSQKHLMRALENRQHLSIQAAATVLATILASSASPEAGEAVIATATGLSLQKEINFTRSNEQEADRVGMQLLFHADYAPANMPTFFKRLQQSTRHDGESLPEYLRTHPLTLSRIADAESRVRQYPAIPPHSDQEFQRIRSQLLVDHYTNPEAAVRFYRSQLQRITDEDEGKIERGDLQYGLALALLHADRADEARQQLLPLLQQNPDQATLLITMAKAEAESNRLADALQRIQQARDLYPVHLGLTLFHAELLQQAQQWARAIEVLLQGGESYPTYPSLHRALSTTYNLAQHPAQSHLSLAHFHFLRGETPLAIRQLEYAEQAAQAAPNNFILFATIDERRRLYEEKEQQEESEGHLK